MENSKIKLVTEIKYYTNGDVVVGDDYIGNANNEPNLAEKVMRLYSITIEELMEQTVIIPS